MTEHDEILVATIARHFPHARTSGDEVEPGFADLRIRCAVSQVDPFGAQSAASLFFQLRGPRLAKEGVFASISGYGATPEQAIIEGGCLWTCTFAPVLRAALAGDDAVALERFMVNDSGATFRGCADALDRAFLLRSGAGTDVHARYAAARARLASDKWLVLDVLASGRIELAQDRATVISVFVLDTPSERVVEVKRDGVDVPGCDDVFAHAPREPDGGLTMLRELAVIVPA